jgi:hypothetical protein
VKFELPVPVSKLSDDSIMLEFAAARRIALIARRLTILSALLRISPRVSLEGWKRCPELAGSYKENDIFPTCGKAGLK